MNIEEAYKILGISKDTSDVELKKIYRKLATENHPDKQNGDPEKMKQINAAHQFVQDYKKNPHKYEQQPFKRSQQPFSGNSPFADVFFNMQQNEGKSFNFTPIQAKVELSFKDSVIGVEREIKYKKYIKCNDCEGKGLKQLKNNCKDCDGTGRKVVVNGNMHYSSLCTSCYGRGVNSEKCKSCGGRCVSEADVNLKIHIPPGVINGNTLRLGGAGHFAGFSFFGEGYSDAFITVKVEKDKDLSLVGADVVSEINISLLDALAGCNKSVRTVFGEKEIKIKPNSKSKDTVVIKGAGIREANGNQNVVLNVEYPKNTKDLIDFLKSKEN